MTGLAGNMPMQDGRPYLPSSVFVHVTDVARLNYIKEKSVIERTGDIFKQPDADAICFTSNGIVDSKGNLVMGAGIALAFKERYPFLPQWIGRQVKKGGNHVYAQSTSRISPSLTLCSYPTKHHWRDPSDLALIIQSAGEIAALATKQGWRRVYLTRPGCGLGRLDWETTVRPAIAPILDDRFIVLTPR